MGIKEGQYEYSTMLRKRVLEVAVSEINEKTDIEVGYELQKHGRKLMAIQFTMCKKNNQKTGLEGQEELKKKLAKFGIDTEQIQYLLEHHDEQYIRANITVVEEQAKKGDIKNITAYLLKAFEKDYRQQETEYDKQQRLVLEEKQKNEAAAAEAAATEKAIKEQFEKWKTEKALDKVQELPTSELEALKTAFTEGMKKSEPLSK